MSLQLDCPKQGSCPGCPLGALPYAQGLERKAGRLAQALTVYPGLLPELLPAQAATPRLHYRLRAKLVVASRRLGLFERGSHRVVDVAGCRVLSPALTRASEALRSLLPLALHGADLRETSEGVLITLLTDTASARTALERAARHLCESGDALSVAVSVRPEGSLRLLAGTPEVLSGPAQARHRLSEEAPYSYAVHGGFVQAHAGQASHVYERIRSGLELALQGLAGREVLELFAGNGALALLLARAGAHVTAVEAYAPASKLAELAAAEQGLRLRAHASDATAFLGDEARAGRHYDAVIINPPRRGLPPLLRSALANLAPSSVVYVSCNPDTLARDLAQLALLGLRTHQVEPLDMIPWSDAMEALCWLAPAPPPLPEVLFEDARFLAVLKSAHESILGSGGLLARVRRLPGCEEAEAAEHPDTVASGACWFAKARAHLESLSQGLRGAERQHLLLVRGNLRKQGTIAGSAGIRYRKERDADRHSLTLAFSRGQSERELLQAFASIRHPVLGDARYGDDKSNQHLAHQHGLDRAFVHCENARFRLDSGESFSATAPLPGDLASVLRSLSAPGDSD